MPMQQTFKTLISIIFAVTLLSSLGLAKTEAATPIYGTKLLNIKQGIRRHLQDGTSTNWAGYVSETNLTNPQSEAINEASGQWTIPTVTCSNRSASYSAAWVGIDGYSDQTVEQTGTEQDCDRGKPVYYAWFEFYPQYEYEVLLPVQPGNNMTADIKYVGKNEFTLTITNISTNRTFSITEALASAQRSSAEWIAEAPSSYLGVLPLADFGTVNFNHASDNINGTVGTITNSAGQHDFVNMLTSFSGLSKATPGVLSTDGSSFSVTWNHS